MVLLLILMIVVINMLVVTRYIFSYSAPWTEEVTRYSMIWLVMLGAGVLTLFDDHITLNLVVDKLPRRARRWQRLLVQVCVFLTAVLIAWEGVHFAAGMQSVVSTALGVSMLYAALSIPLGAALIAAFAAVRIVLEIADIRGTKSPQLPEQHEFMDNSFKSLPPDDAHAPIADGQHEAPRSTKQ